MFYDKNNLEAMASYLPLVLFEVDFTGNVIWGNQRGTELFGYDFEDLEYGITFRDFLAPEERERAIKSLVSIMSGEVAAREYMGMNKQGKKFPIIVISKAVMEDGKPVGMCGAIIEKSLFEKER